MKNFAQKAFTLAENYERRKKKVLSEVGFEPTPTYVDQRPRTHLCEQGFYLESGALDHSATLTGCFKQ